MKAYTYLSLGASLAGGALAASSSNAYDTIPSIEAVGQHFFYANNGSQFFLKGVAYQQDDTSSSAPTKRDSTVDYNDPLDDESSCARDIPYMKQIFTNVIRVYAINPNASHDACMNLLAENDIYVISDLSSPDLSINSNDPEWSETLYNRYTSVVDAMAKYNNVIGFFAGNEVVESANQTGAAAYVKAAVRDTKSYIKNAGYRTSLGVGYATADVPTRSQLAEYFACDGTDAGNSTSIDFWGYNVYSWCGDSSYTAASYDERYDFFKDYPVPAFFSEYGCIDGVTGGATHRPFTEVPVLYGNMSDVFSGGIVYEWFMAANDYGLVSVDGSSISVYPDFTSLKNQLAKVSPKTTMLSAYSTSNTLPACPTTDASWVPKASPLPAVVNENLCSCMMDSLDCTITSTDSTQYEDIFNYVCGLDSGKYCDGIASNSSTGDYGAYSGCDSQQQLAWVVNAYYTANSASASCSFSGLAATQSASTAKTCTSLLSAAGTGGTGSVGAASGTGSGSSASSSGNAAGNLNTPAFFQFGKTLFVAYALGAVLSGVGMIML